MTDNVNATENENQVTADTAQAEGNTAAAGLGKFKSVDALMSAYLSLEAEFTRRSQRLKELEEGSKARSLPQSADGVTDTQNAQSAENEAPSQSAENSKAELLQAALADSGVREAVIGEYLKTVASNKSIPLIVGGVSSPAPKAMPKTVREAGALAERFLKN